MASDDSQLHDIRSAASFHELKNWCTNSLGLFVTLLQEMYQDFRHRKPFWRIGPSTIEEGKHSMRSGYFHQTFYQVVADPVGKMIVAVPAYKSFRVKVVHIGFIVHNRSVNPTHKLGFCYARHVPCLLPIKRTEVGDEFCFRRMHKPFKVIVPRPHYKTDALSFEI